MAARVVDIARARRKAVRTEIDGLRELETTVRDLISFADDDRSMSAGQKARRTVRARNQLSAVLGEAAWMLKERIKANAESQGWPRAVINAIFTYNDVARNPKRFKYTQSRSALAGIRKGAPPRRDMEIYREWNPGKSWGGVTGGYLSAKGKKVLKKGLVSGRLIGMSLASMFEFGTSKMAARPAFRPALKAVQQAVLQHVANGYKRIIEHFAEAA